MRHRIYLPRTGDFWLDIGLIGIWKYLVARSANNPDKTSDGFRVKISKQQDLYNAEEETGVSVNLVPTGLMLEYNEYESLKLQLTKSMEYLKMNYLGKT